MDNLSDDQLMSMIQKGETQFISEIYLRYKIKIYRYFIGFSINRSVSEDLTHTVFERILKFSYSYRLGRNFQFWLFGVARNTKNKYFNEVKKRKILEEQFNYEKNFEPSQAELNTDSRNHKINHLKIAFECLSESEKEIIILAKIKELKYSDIAYILDITENNVKIKVFRILRKLKETMQ